MNLLLPCAFRINTTHYDLIKPAGFEIRVDGVDEIRISAEFCLANVWTARL